MQNQQESALICKVTTTSQNAAGLFNYHSQFLTHAYSMIGCTLFVESIDGGAIVFYHTIDDFLKFHKFATQLAPLDILPSQAPDDKAKNLYLRIEFVKKPRNMSIEELARIMEKSHKILSPDISVKVKSPTVLLLRYKSEGIFDLIFKKIWDTLGDKLNQITPALK